LPSSWTEIDITENHLKEIINWYERRDYLTKDKKNRFNIASQFIQYGIIADELERFIHFFISLDSIFGERHSVERLISEGISKTFPKDKLWEYKIKRLFDLRSELVHGGCSSILDWENLDAYKKHCKSSPLNDVITASMTAFRNI
jgi:hypothetical protein